MGYLIMRKASKISFIALLIIAVTPAHFFGNSHDVKIIEWGWNTPLPEYVKEHIQDMEKLPFDGLVLDLKVNQGPAGTAGLFSWNVWGAEVLQLENYSASYGALKGIRFGRFTDNFLRFNVVPGNIDWFDTKFTSVIANAVLAARIAKTCKLKGILLDVEQYQGTPYNYATQPNRNAYRFSDYQQRVRQRGQEFIRAVNAVYPDINILLTYGYYLAYARKKPLENEPYGLLPAFLDGMLEAASSETIIYDGWEPSYGYKKEEKFHKAYQTISQLVQERNVITEEARRRYRASFGLWLDHRSIWDKTDLSKNYFAPDEFESSLRYALKYTDRYVWIYSQKVNWWDGQIPQPYIEAIHKAQSVSDLPSN
jgi:hypothetical protein